MIALLTLDLAEASRIIQAGMARAAAIGSPSTLAVVDASGTMIAQIRMDGARLASAELAASRAVSALTWAQPGGDTYGFTGRRGGRAVILPGGMPIEADGQVIGAIGVSGGTGAQDEEIARVAASALAAAPAELVYAR
jgi:uncharacterized protein GlcG (DUF336 family)